MTTRILILISASLFLVPSGEAQVITEVYRCRGCIAPDLIRFNPGGELIVAGNEAPHLVLTTSGDVVEWYDLHPASNLCAGRFSTEFAVHPSGDLIIGGKVSGSNETLVRRGIAGGTTELIDWGGDGLGNPLDGVSDIECDASGAVYVSGRSSDNVFRVDPNGAISEIIDASGDGLGADLALPEDLCLDAAGAVYVVGRASATAFRIEPNGAVTKLIDGNGDGLGNALAVPTAIAVGLQGEVFVAGTQSDNVFRIDANGTITEILDSSAAGVGPGLDAPTALAVGAAGELYVVSGANDALYRVDSTGVVTEILLANSGGSVPIIDGASAVAVDPSGDVFVAGRWSHNVARFDPPGSWVEVVSPLGGASTPQRIRPTEVLADEAGGVYLTGEYDGGLLHVDATGDVTELLAPPGPSLLPINQLRVWDNLLLDPSGAVFVSSRISDTVVRVGPSGGVEVVYSNALAPGGVSDPGALAPDLPSGGLLVRTGVSTIHRIDPAGPITLAWNGAAGDCGATGGTSIPPSFATDDSGSLYASCVFSERVVRVEPTGASSIVFDSGGLTGGFRQFVSDGSTVYFGGISSGIVFRLDPPGTVTTWIDQTSLGPGSAIIGYHDLEIDAASRVHAAVSSIGAPSGVYRWDASGDPTLMAMTDGLGGAELCSAARIAVSSGGLVFAADALGQRVVRIELVEFIRGDANQDGSINIADALAILGHLFGGPTLSCPAAGNIEPTTTLNISDPIQLLLHLFSAGPPPSAPFPDCGPPAVGETAGCAAAPACP